MIAAQVEPASAVDFAVLALQDSQQVVDVLTWSRARSTTMPHFADNALVVSATSSSARVGAVAQSLPELAGEPGRMPDPMPAHFVG